MSPPIHPEALHLNQYICVFCISVAGSDTAAASARKAELPSQWNRPYLGYNPRTRDRELGSAAAAARADQRVFSDSEIYSPVFPRGRPEPRVDVSARVEAMRKEFAEYQRQMSLPSDSTSPAQPGAGSKKNSAAVRQPPIAAKDLHQPVVVTSTGLDEDRLESLI